jgi:biotin operon repressor
VTITNWTPHRESFPSRVYQMLLDGRVHTRDELDALPGPHNTVSHAIYRLRTYGAQIETIETAGALSYRLLTRDGYQAPHARGAAQRLLPILADRQPHTIPELMAALQVNAGSVLMGIYRLRKRGARIARITRGGQAEPVYQLERDVTPDATATSPELLREIGV